MLRSLEAIDETIEVCPYGYGRCFGLRRQMPWFGTSQLELAFEVGEGYIDIAHGHAWIDVAE